MNNNMYKLVYLCLTLALFYSCNSASTKNKEDNLTVNNTTSKTIIEPNYLKKSDTVLMQIKNNKISLSEIEKPIEVEITNYTSKKIILDQDYSIEVLEGRNYWQELPFIEKLIFADIVYELKPASSQVYKIRLHALKYNYKLGKYRVLKTYKKENYNDKKYKTYNYFFIQ